MSKRKVFRRGPLQYRLKYINEGYSVRQWRYKDKNGRWGRWFNERPNLIDNGARA